MNDDFFELPDKEFSLNNDKEKQNRENGLDLFFKILDKEKIQYDLAPYTKRKFINNQIGLLGDYKLYISVDPNTDMKKICSYLNKELIKFGCHVSRDEYNTLILSYDKSLLVKEQEIRNYNTIVFDIGGVLIEREEIDLRDLRKLGIYDEVELRQLMIIYYDIANENDTATYKEVLEKYEKALPDRFKPKAKELIELSMHKRVCKYTVPLLKELKSKGYKLYYLSNASKHRHEVSKKKGLLNFLEYFDGGLISYKEGVEKPNPEFYNRLLKKYKLKASDCLFIDDNSSNIETAQNLGFKTLYYNNPKSIDLYSIIESAYMVNETLELPEDNNTLEEILNNTSPNKIYFTSDWHLFKNHYKHEANYVNTRNIIAWCRQNIKDNDIFFYLGDISFRWANEEDQEESMKIMASLPGIKVLILGNHDKMLGQDYFANCGFKYVFEEYTWKNYIFTHKPINMDMHSENMLNIHGHIHNITKYNTTDGKRNINVYPMYYDNKPVTLSYITSHVEELTKDHEWNWNVGYGESALLEAKRSELPDSSFGIPEDRKYPLDTEQHVKSAIKLFGHAEESKKKSLAKRINVAAKKYDITIPETTQCYKYLSEEVINSCYELSNCIELPSDSNITSEWAMASCNPIKGISKPFILKITPDNNSTINPKLYAFSPDIISDKYLVVNENAELEIVNYDRFNNCFIESYEFIGENQDYLLGKIYKAYKGHKIVDNTFFYTTLTGKPMLCEDQIDYDSLFRKVDLDLIVENINTELATLNENMMKCIYNISTTLPVLESVANKVSFTKRYDGISIKEDINGYYFGNEYTNKRSRSEKNIHSLTEAMLKSTL